MTAIRSTAPAPPEPTLRPRIVDVSEWPYETVAGYVAAAATVSAYIERKGDRTLLVLP